MKNNIYVLQVKPFNQKAALFISKENTAKTKLFMKIINNFKHTFYPNRLIKELITEGISSISPVKGYPLTGWQIINFDAWAKSNFPRISAAEEFLEYSRKQQRIITINNQLILDLIPNDKKNIWLPEIIFLGTLFQKSRYEKYIDSFLKETFILSSQQFKKSKLCKNNKIITTLYNSRYIKTYPYYITAYDYLLTRQHENQIAYILHDQYFNDSKYEGEQMYFVLPENMNFYRLNTLELWYKNIAYAKYYSKTKGEIKNHHFNFNISDFNKKIQTNRKNATIRKS